MYVFSSIPTTTKNDGSGTNSVSVMEPQAGTWYLYAFVEAPAKRAVQADVTFVIRYQSASCPPFMTGPGCNITIYQQNSTSLITQSLGNQSWAYFQITISPGQSFNVTVKASDSSNSQPLVFASLGQIPTATTADISGCNNAFCSYATIIQVSQPNITTLGNATWYIGVYSENATSFGIWFNSICAPQCDIYGSCSNDPTSFGECNCIEDLYVGLDCQTPNNSGLPAQYIVLIIIASLVVASAVIGFIAWAYMRRKRVGYEKVA